MAEAVLEQLQETADYREWLLEAVSIMPTHFHAVTDAPAELSPDRLLGDYKAYASRKLTRTFGTTASDEWWTDKGSKRPLKGDRALDGAVEYVLYKQPDSLAVRSRRLGRLK